MPWIEQQGTYPTLVLASSRRKQNLTTIEGIGEPFLYRWPGGEVRLEPGKPIELPDERAKRLLIRAPGRVRVIPTFEPGAMIGWTRQDGTNQTSQVDFVHTDAAGSRWAFVSLGETWAAVNMKFVRRADDWPAALAGGAV